MIYSFVFCFFCVSAVAVVNEVKSIQQFLTGAAHLKEHLFPASTPYPINNKLIPLLTNQLHIQVCECASV